jgi:sulfonate transport system substrate-binding protein
MKLRILLPLLLCLSLLLTACPAPAAAPGAAPAAGEGAAKPETIRLDYAYYNPSSLVLRKFGWLEEELAKENITVEWVLSAGSNKANEFLRSEAIDFGSTAGAAALLAAANGSPIETVYIYSKPEWTALVVGKDSTLQNVAELKGKKIAATKGTDPYFFLLRSLHANGLSAADVEIVNLQHADGRTALERGDVDAWAGLDPFMAQTELEQGSRLIYRNIDFNSYGFLNARSEFTSAYPQYTELVLTQYERARQWILDNQDEAAQILADEAKLSLDVAKRELFERTVLDESPVPGEAQHAALTAIIPIFTAENQVKEGTDVAAVLDKLFNTKFIEAVTK